jgi:hypothetical protein
MVMRKGLWCLLVLYFCLPMEKEKDNRLDISVMRPQKVSPTWEDDYKGAHEC